MESFQEGEGRMPRHGLIDILTSQKRQRLGAETFRQRRCQQQREVVNRFAEITVICRCLYEWGGSSWRTAESFEKPTAGDINFAADPSSGGRIDTDFPPARLGKEL